MLALLWLAAKFILLLAGLLLPGAALARALGLPRLLATSFAGSALALYATVVALQLAAVRISLASLAAGLLLIGAVAVAAARLAKRHPAAGAAPASGAPPAAPERGWLVLYGIFWLAVLWRGWQQPLSGPEVVHGGMAVLPGDLERPRLAIGVDPRRNGRRRGDGRSGHDQIIARARTACGRDDRAIRGLRGGGLFSGR